MRLNRASTWAGLFFSTSLIATSASARPKPGEGVLCLWALTSTASEVGKRCPDKVDAALQQVLQESVGKIDAYVATNGPATADDIANFKTAQGGLGSSTETLCAGESAKLYDSIKASGADALRKMIHEAIERSGKPTWGDCF